MPWEFGNWEKCEGNLPILTKLRPRCKDNCVSGKFREGLTNIRKLTITMIILELAEWERKWWDLCGMRSPRPSIDHIFLWRRIWPSNTLDILLRQYYQGNVWRLLGGTAAYFSLEAPVVRWSPKLSASLDVERSKVKSVIFSRFWRFLLYWCSVFVFVNDRTLEQMVCHFFWKGVVVGLGHLVESSVSSSSSSSPSSSSRALSSTVMKQIMQKVTWLTRPMR